MKVINFKPEVAEIAVAEGFAFDDLDLVVDPLHFGSGDAKAKVIQDPLGVAAQECHSGAEGFGDPIGQEGNGLVL